MKRLEILHHIIRNLTPRDYSSFHDWFLGYDAFLWDCQIEEDARSGKLDRLAEEAVKAHCSGKTRPL